MKKHWGQPVKIAAEPFDVHRIYVADDGEFPNNRDWPTLLYKSAFDGDEAGGRSLILRGGEWTDPWTWGVFPYHHYHTKAWELLLCVSGRASIQVGGDGGPVVSVSRGDLMLVPPGVAHKQLDEGGGFALLGSYPREGFDGRIDTVRGVPTKEQRERIESCHVPDRDPIFGLDVRELCGREVDVALTSQEN